jgi:hypothetical protein
MLPITPAYRRQNSQADLRIMSQVSPRRASLCSRERLPPTIQRTADTFPHQRIASDCGTVCQSASTACSNGGD